jgi:hypothetical protein
VEVKFRKTNDSAIAKRSDVIGKCDEETRVKAGKNGEAFLV